MSMNSKQSIQEQQHNMLPDPHSLDNVPDDQTDVEVKDIWRTKPPVSNFQPIDPGSNAAWE